MKKGSIIIISGPSGVGKKTIIDQFINNDELNLCYSISMTTREPRQGEQNGVDYYFVTNEEFNDAIKNNKLLEWAEFATNKYGTPLERLYEKINEGKNVILEIEVVGAMDVMAKLDKDEYFSIFIVPPSIDELKRRLITRNTETLEKINKRIERAKVEITTTRNYDYVVLNDCSTRAANEIIEIIKREIEKQIYEN